MKRLLLLAALASTASAENRCVDCHEPQQKLLADSAHLVFGCADCHNGREEAEDMDAAHSPAADFVGRPAPSDLARMCASCHEKETKAFELSPHAAATRRGDPGGATCISCHTLAATPTAHAIADCGDEGAPSGRFQVAATCARCHSDAEAMKRSGLRIDQFAQYRASAHGYNVLEEKEGDAATCADCHSPHEAPSARDPRSETHPRNQAHLCGACHGDVKLMTEHGKDPGVVAKWQASAHARNLDLGAPSCAGCHGAHYSHVPEPAAIRESCGRCHEGPARELAAGPHGPAVHTDPATLASAPVHCAHCHDAHGGAKPLPPYGATACAACHAADSHEIAEGNAMSDLSAALHTDLVALHQKLEEARRRGHDLPSCRETLSALDARTHDFASLVHGVSPAKCAAEREAVGKESKALMGRLSEFTPGERRLWWVPVMWVFVFLGVGLLFLKARKLKSPQGR
ncbi:MAG: hypothetical protein HYY18_21630 [Planctomycetes bacterium]|nr:hypothetical protein [Planctomycetota bacterium]